MSMGSQGRVERELSAASPEIRQSLTWITAKMPSGNEESLLTSHSGDGKAVWKELRRDFILQGFASPHIREHKHLINGYIRELGDKGLLDEP